MFGILLLFTGISKKYCNVGLYYSNFNWFDCSSCKPRSVMFRTTSTDVSTMFALTYWSTSAHRQYPEHFLAGFIVNGDVGL